jgi:hypothetical protein
LNKTRNRFYLSLASEEEINSWKRNLCQMSLR